MRDDSHFKSREGAATFEEYNVSPAVVQLADLFALADLAESAGFVEGDTGVVFQEDSRLEGPDAIALRLLDEREQEGFAVASARAAAAT